MLKGWSKTQSLVALSSGESELCASLKAAAETLGMISVMKDLGREVTGEVWGDASAALGIINRRGLGKTRHIDTGLLWIKQTAAERQVQFSKLLGRNNPADLYAKHLDASTMENTRGPWLLNSVKDEPRKRQGCTCCKLMIKICAKVLKRYAMP